MADIIRRSVAKANNSEIVSSEYWLNLVVIFKKDGKHYTQAIPGCGFPLDSILQNTINEAPNEGASMSSVINQMKAELPDFAKDILNAAKSVEKGKRAILFYCDTTDEKGNLKLTNFALEIYHKNPSQEKAKLTQDTCEKQERVPLRVNSIVNE